MRTDAERLAEALDKVAELEGKNAMLREQVKQLETALLHNVGDIQREKDEGKYLKGVRAQLQIQLASIEEIAAKYLLRARTAEAELRELYRGE